MTVSQRFGTSTTLTEVYTRSTTISTELKLTFVSVGGMSSNEWEHRQETNSWENKIMPLGWQTTRQQFPGDGDLIVFYRRPKFRITWEIGRHDYSEGVPGDIVEVYPEPIFRRLRPIRDEQQPANPQDATWVVVPTIRGWLPARAAPTPPRPRAGA